METLVITQKTESPEIPTSVYILRALAGIGGLSLIGAFLGSFNPVDPFEIDRDRDGLSDGLERIIGTDPEEQDSDKDSLSDYYELFFKEWNGRIPVKILDGINIAYTEKHVWNIDGDNLINPLDPDDDEDGYSTQFEIEMMKEIVELFPDVDINPDGDTNKAVNADGTLFVELVKNPWYDYSSDGDEKSDGEEWSLVKTERNNLDIGNSTDQKKKEIFDQNDNSVPDILEK